MNEELIKALEITMPHHEAVKKANGLQFIVEEMRKGETKFRFLKTDGSIRSARGTLDLTLVPKEKQPKTKDANEDSTKKKNVLVQTYFDLDKSEWRSFKVSNLVI